MKQKIGNKAEFTATDLYMQLKMPDLVVYRFITKLTIQLRIKLFLLARA